MKRTTRPRRSICEAATAGAVVEAARAENAGRLRSRCLITPAVASRQAPCAAKPPVDGPCQAMSRHQTKSSLVAATADDRHHYLPLAAATSESGTDALRRRGVPRRRRGERLL